MVGGISLVAYSAIRPAPPRPTLFTDSLSWTQNAWRIDLEAVRNDQPCNVLIQVNLTGAQTQGGMSNRPALSLLASRHLTGKPG